MLKPTTATSHKIMINNVEGAIPVLLSPLFKRSDEVFEYENPTPTGESRNKRFAAANK